MYVNKRKRVRAKDKRLVWSFELLRGYRDASRLGAPRNKFVCYIATITAEPTPSDRFRFRRQAEEKLARLSLSAQDEQNIRTKLKRWVPRPASLAEVVDSIRREVDRRARRHKSAPGSR